ncbi:MAG: stage IV sporulation protein A [Velocimicrobium sp.]
MDNLNTSSTFHVYNDIKTRTNGEIYIGVVGPVRTGKSTFIKNFMEILVIPGMEDVHSKERTIDELPQSSQGKTIMTTEPKFIPKEAALISFGDESKAKVRLIDCVGFMVEGASGHIENEQERLVKTPWFEEEIPFTQAAEIGTKKVITDHSTVGIVITTDGSFGELERQNYIEPELRTIEELKKFRKPFIVVLNSNHPFSEETVELASKLSHEYGVKVIPINCKQLKQSDIHAIIKELLDSFPVTRINFQLPKWAEMLDNNHWLKKDCIHTIRSILSNVSIISQVTQDNFKTSSDFINQIKLNSIHLENGEVEAEVEFDNQYYYDILSDLVGMQIGDEEELICLLKELSEKRSQYDLLSEASNQVQYKGYGIVIPSHEDISLEAPEIVKHGNKFGVKIKANAPSIHMIKANIETEIAPIVGSEEQAQDLIRYIAQNATENSDGIWDTNIFGKTIKQLVDDGIKTKVNRLTDESQVKLQETIQKVINDSNGGLVCIII